MLTAVIFSFIDWSAFSLTVKAVHRVSEGAAPTHRLLALALTIAAHIHKLLSHLHIVTL
jgi:hypothetical protein